ncbi:MAG: N-acetyl-D-Glu racemase DgcA [Bacteroidota bacterium]
MRLTVRPEYWPVDGHFTISRGTLKEIPVIVVEVEADGLTGRGEACGIRYKGETPDSMIAQIEAVRKTVEAGLTRDAAQTLLPPGGARNALDCALWELESLRTGTPAWQLAGIPEPRALTTAYTLSIDTPANMAAKTRQKAGYELFKIKLGVDEHDLDRVRAVREAAPDARLITDANEGWSRADLDRYVPALHQLGVELIEQPLKRGEDHALAGYDGPIPLCADESCQTTESLDHLPAGGYQVVNIKLDKTGGLTEGLRLMQAALDRGYELMIGCMVGTSLAMAPAFLIGQHCRFVDLDGPLLQAKDRPGGFVYQKSQMLPGAAWGA